MIISFMDTQKVQFALLPRVMKEWTDFSENLRFALV